MAQDLRSTRIVATLGPASADPRVLRKMVKAGLDVARLNMSHGDHAFHEQMYAEVRRAAREAGRPLGVMADLQGPKLRLGRFAEPVRLRKGARVTLTTKARETDAAALVLPVDYNHLPEETEAGHDLLLADGVVRMRVESVRGHRVICRVLEGQVLQPRAGLSLPDAKVRGSAITAKDRRDLKLAARLGVDFVALSFVRRPEDLLAARRLMRRAGSDALLIAKVETCPAVESIDEIVAEADGVMVARGDLGVEMPPEAVPGVQKRLIRLADASGKPVITATQMLESMRVSSRPTRAEASDVANAVLDGSWAVMLSAETAAGEYPVESVAMMCRIVREAEDLLLRQSRRRDVLSVMGVSEGIAQAGARLAVELGARALVALTRSGSTARQLARFPLHMPIYAYTPSATTLTRMTLYRGVQPRRIPEQKGLERAISKIEKDLRARRDVRRGDRLVMIGGAPDEPMGTTSRLVVHDVR